MRFSPIGNSFLMLIWCPCRANPKILAHPCAEETMLRRRLRGKYMDEGLLTVPLSSALWEIQGDNAWPCSQDAHDPVWETRSRETTIEHQKYFMKHQENWPIGQHFRRGDGQMGQDNEGPQLDLQMSWVYRLTTLNTQSHPILEAKQGWGKKENESRREVKIVSIDSVFRNFAINQGSWAMGIWCPDNFYIRWEILRCFSCWWYDPIKKEKLMQDGKFV